MKRILRYMAVTLLCVISLVTALSAKDYRVEEIRNVQLANRTHFVSNPDGILSPKAVAELNDVALSLKERGLAEVAIVVVSSIDPDDPFTFAVDLFEKWGVGNEKADNGLGILLVDDVHEIRFVTGYGLEGVLPDARCVQLQHEYMLPHFRNGDYDRGMVEGLRAVDTLLSSGELEGVTNSEEEEREAMIAGLVIVVLLVILPLALLLIASFKASKCPNCGKHSLKVVERHIERNPSNPMMDNTITILVCQHCHSRHRRTQQTPRRGGGGGMGGPIIFGGFGGGRGFGGGGGFGGGFGGGSFGGGGGGSRW